MSQDNVILFNENIKLPDNVVVLDVVTSLNIPAERILTAALQDNLEGVIVIGYTHAGEEYFASSVADGGTVLWCLERAKLKLLTVDDHEVD